MTDQSDRRAPITARVIEIDAARRESRVPRPIGAAGDRHGANRTQ